MAFYYFYFSKCHILQDITKYWGVNKPFIKDQSRYNRTDFFMNIEPLSKITSFFCIKKWPNIHEFIDYQRVTWLLVISHLHHHMHMTTVLILERYLNSLDTTQRGSVNAMTIQNV